MLRLMREQPATQPGPAPARFVFEHTVFWDKAISLAAEADPDAERTGNGNASGEEDAGGAGDGAAAAATLDELRLQPGGYARAYDGAMFRHLAVQEARRAGAVASDGDTVDATDRFRVAHGLSGTEGLATWLAGQRLSLPWFDQLMREEALVSRARGLHRPGTEGALLDHLRLRGEYGRLLTRARDKDRLLRSQGLNSPKLEDAGVTAQAVLEWYFRRCSRSVPAPLGPYARWAGFVDEQALLLAVVREYCYVRLKNRAHRAGAQDDAGSQVGTESD